MQTIGWVSCLMLLLGACSESGSGGDGGGLDGDAVDGGGDQAPGDRVCPPADHEPEGLRIRFEPGSRACTGFHDFASWQSEVEMAGRLTFRPGVVILEEFQQGQREVDWIESLEVGQEKRQATRLGDALLTYEFLEYGDPREGCHRYWYDQPWNLDGRNFTLSGVMTFCLSAGVPREPDICVWEDFTRGRLSFWGLEGEPGTNDYQSFGPCHYYHIPLWIIGLQVENGDALTLHKRFQIPAGGSGPARIVQAGGSVGGTSFTIEDPFRLVYAADHHNWNEKYVVLFDPPIGEVHGLLTGGIGEGTTSGTLVYLGADLEELRTAGFSVVEFQGPI